MADPVRSLFTHPAHLGLGSRVAAQPAFTDLSWYADYAARTAADGGEGRLVSLYRFDESWASWEMHPAGDEMVICIAGSVTLVQEGVDGAAVRLELGPGDYAINGPGVWHTADVTEAATCLFITAGQGTQHRPR